MSAAFSYPAGTYSRDRSSGPVYDAPYQRWFAPPTILSPDGTRLLRVDRQKLTPTPTSLFAVDIATAREHLIAVVSDASPVAWLGSGIYYLHDAPGSDPGLMVLDPMTGISRVVTGPSNATHLPLFKAWTAFNGGAVWSKTVENSGGPNGDVLVRVDLTSGRAEAWFGEHALRTVDVLGFTPGGNPLVALSGGDVPRLALLTGPGVSTAIQPGDFRSAQPPSEAVGVSDNHGVWILSDDGGIWLFAGGTMTRVDAATLPPPVSPMSEMGPSDRRWSSPVHATDGAPRCVSAQRVTPWPGNQRMRKRHWRASPLLTKTSCFERVSHWGSSVAASGSSTGSPKGLRATLDAIASPGVEKATRWARHRR